MSEQWLTTNDIADLFRVHPASVRRWRSQKAGPPGLRINGVWRYRRSEVERWARAQGRSTGAGA